MKIVNFKASNFEGVCNVDEEFALILNQMNNVAIMHNMNIQL